MAHGETAVAADSRRARESRGLGGRRGRSNVSRWFAAGPSKVARTHIRAAGSSEGSARHKSAGSGGLLFCGMVVGIEKRTRRVQRPPQLKGTLIDDSVSATTLG